jgi:hypothetical protein
MQGGLQSPAALQSPAQLPPLNFANSNEGPSQTSPTATQQPPPPNHAADREGLPPSLQQPQPPTQGQGMGQPPHQPFPPTQLPSQTRDNPPQVGNHMHHRQDLPPLNPVFGTSLEELFRRDGSAVPMIVYQCLQAVDLFGLEVEGIYRLSGTATHVMQMKSMFDNGMVPQNLYPDSKSHYSQIPLKSTSETQKASSMTSTAWLGCSSSFSEISQTRSSRRNTILSLSMQAVRT